MIKVLLRGRLGNHLFQYAFAKIAAQKLKTKFILDTNDVPRDIYWFNLDLPYRFLNNPLIFKIYNLFQKQLKFSKTKDYNDCTLPQEAVILEEDSLYLGYFQYSKMLEEYRDVLIKTFTIKKKIEGIFKLKYPIFQTAKKTLVISVRLGDYRNTFLAEYNNAPIIIKFEWYYKVLTTLNLKDYHVFIISDEIEFVEKEFSFPGLNALFVKEHPSIQFQMLTNADIAVLSNSTFAWWGGFLNTKPGKRIIAPKYFLGHNIGIEFPNGIQSKLFEWV